MSKLYSGDDVVTVPAASAFSDLDPYTYAAFIYITSYGGGVPRILHKGDRSFYLRDDAGGAATFLVTVNYGGGQVNAMATDNQFLTGRWYYVAATFLPGTGGPRLWKADLSVATPSVAECAYAVRTSEVGLGGPLGDGGSDLLIGNLTGGGFAFDGKLSQLVIAGTALNIAQHQQMITAVGVAGSVIPSADLRGWWQFNDAGATAVDSSVNGNHGTVSGAVADADEPDLAGTPPPPPPPPPGPPGPPPPPPPPGTGTYMIRERRGAIIDTQVTLGITDALIRGPIFSPVSRAELQAMEMGASRGSEPTAANIQVEDMWLMVESADAVTPGTLRIDLKHQRFGLWR